MLCRKDDARKRVIRRYNNRQTPAMNYGARLPTTQPIGWVGFDVIPSHRFWWIAAFIGCDEHKVEYELTGF
jgi:hypothetical protein